LHKKPKKDRAFVILDKELKNQEDMNRAFLKSMPKIAQEAVNELGRDVALGIGDVLNGTKKEKW
jgi:hypothetical protein